MKHFYYGDVPLSEIGSEARNSQRRWLVDEGIGAHNFTVAEVEIMPGGNTLHHSHHYEHAIFILEGNGEVVDSTGTSPITPWEVLYIAPNELHQIKNSGEKMLRFLTIEPIQKNEEKRS